MYDYSNIIKIFENCNWLSSYGEKNTGLDIVYKWAKDSKEVEKLISGLKWENECIDRGNDVSGYMRDNYSEIRSTWNEELINLKKGPLVEIQNKMHMIILDKGISQVVETDMICNTISIIESKRYSEYIHSDFYDNLLKIYLSGHVACGYKRGCFIIY